jgi:hypothetical protein
MLLNSSAVIPEKVWEVVKLTAVTVALVGALVILNVGTLVGWAEGATIGEADEAIKEF